MFDNNDNIKIYYCHLKRIKIKSEYGNLMSFDGDPTDQQRNQLKY